jgi:hypothetical protein
MAKQPRQQRTKLTAQVVEKLRVQFEAGDHAALLEAVDFCARGGMAMPVWLAKEFCQRYEDWRMFRAKSLDQAFGVERRRIRPKNRALWAWLKPSITLRVLELHGEGEAKQPDLFDAGELRKKHRIKISGASVSKLYYADDNQWRSALQKILRKPRSS